jgi:hypothetical protein
MLVFEGLYYFMANTMYFSHDVTARQDEKVKDLIFKHGLLGYGIFWAIVEDLYQNENVLQTNFERISFELRCDIGVLKSVINDFNLFVFNEDQFGSMSVQKRLDKQQEKSAKAKESINYRWSYERNTNVIRPKTDRNTIKESKVNKSKVKESKVNGTYADVEIYPTFQDFWDLYEKKVGLDLSQKKWEKLTQAEKEKIMQHIPHYKIFQPNPKFRQNPTTYLNQKTYNDDIQSIPDNSAKQSNSKNGTWLDFARETWNDRQANSGGEPPNQDS